MGRGGSRPSTDVPGPVPGGRAGTRWAGRWGGGRSHVDGGFDPPALAGGELGRGQGGAAGRSQGRGRQPWRPGCIRCPREADVEGASSAASPATPDSGGRLGSVIAGVLPEGGTAGEGKGSRRRRSQRQLGSAGPTSARAGSRDADGRAAAGQKPRLGAQSRGAVRMKGAVSRSQKCYRV